MRGRRISVIPSPGSQAERARMLREAMGYSTQKAFAQRYGFSLARWNNYERGWPIPYRVAYGLAGKIKGLSALWITEGDEGGLSLEMARKLRIVPPDESLSAPYPSGDAV